MEVIRVMIVKSSKYLISSVLLLVFLFLCVSCAADPTLKGSVVKVTDGDTIVLLINNQEQRIRLNGIDCPERGQAFGTVARSFVGDLVFSKEVRVVSEGLDRYQRVLGWVYLEDGRCLNHELLKAGLAWHYKDYNSDPDLAAMEVSAKAAKKGLWVDPHPIPPWEYRRNRRN